MTEERNLEEPRPRGRGVTVDPSLRVRDRASQLFVIGAVLVFAGIFINAMAFGKGGALTTTPSPSPVLNVSLPPSTSFSPSTLPSLPPSVAPSNGPSVAPSNAPSPAASQ